MKKVLIINGPNLNLLGTRQKEIYGNRSFDDFLEELKKYSTEKGIALSYFQSNSEGEIVNKIHESMGKTDYIIMNPGALTHYSYSLHDAITSADIPVIEVHLSNIYSRENWRSKSVISPAATGVISGFGLTGYMLAINYISESKKQP